MEQVPVDVSGRHDEGAGMNEDDEEQVPCADSTTVVPEEVEDEGASESGTTPMAAEPRVDVDDRDVEEVLAVPRPLQADFPTGVNRVRRRINKKTRPMPYRGVARDVTEDDEQVPF